MTNPAEKIRQVVEELAYFAPSKNDKGIHTLVLEFEDVKTALAAQLDAIIEEAECKYTDEGRIPTLASFIEELKEARSSLDSGCTSITNSTHE